MAAVRDPAQNAFRVQCLAGCEIIIGIIARQRHLRAMPDIAGNRCGKNTSSRTKVVAS